MVHMWAVNWLYINIYEWRVKLPVRHTSICGKTGVVFGGIYNLGVTQMVHWWQPLYASWQIFGYHSAHDVRHLGRNDLLDDAHVAPLVCCKTEVVSLTAYFFLCNLSSQIILKSAKSEPGNDVILPAYIQLMVVYSPNRTWTMSRYLFIPHFCCILAYQCIWSKMQIRCRTYKSLQCCSCCTIISVYSLSVLADHTRCHQEKVSQNRWSKWKMGYWSFPVGLNDELNKGTWTFKCFAKSTSEDIVWYYSK